MANTRELRRRIKSVKNTAQITKAMQMVSATKMRRAQNQALSSRPYTNTLSDILFSIAPRTDPSNHPLLMKRVSTKVGILLLTTDKGLAGALNTNLFRTIQSKDFLNDPVFYTMGKKGRDFIVRTGKKLEADFENTEKIAFSQAVRLRKFLINEFLNDKIGEVYLLYADFKSTLRQEPKLVKLLPVVLEGSEGSMVPQMDNNEFVYEPTSDLVMDYALNHTIDTQIYQALLETKASEHSSRMMAMQNATNNALDIVQDLQLTYNQVRQDAITREILEISSGSAALE